MPKINLKLPYLEKKSWIILAVTLFLLISLPLGLYLSQNTQIFNPKAYEITDIGGGSSEFACTKKEADYGIRRQDCTTSDGCVGQRLSRYSRTISEEVFECVWSEECFKLDPSCNYNSQNPLPETVYPSELPADYIKTLQLIGFYPYKEGGEVLLLSRYDYIQKVCPSDSNSCVPDEDLSFEKLRKDNNLLRDVMTKLYENGYAPVPALKPYFLDEVKNIISQSANPDIYQAFETGNMSIIGPQLNKTTEQFKQSIEPEQLRNIINQVAYDHQLSTGELPLMTSLINIADGQTIGGVRAVITIFALPADIVTDGQRAAAVLGVVGIASPVLIKPVATGIGAIISEVKNLIKGSKTVNMPLELSTIRKLVTTTQNFYLNPYRLLGTAGFHKKIGRVPNWSRFYTRYIAPSKYINQTYETGLVKQADIKNLNELMSKNDDLKTAFRVNRLAIIDTEDLVKPTGDRLFEVVRRFFQSQGEQAYYVTQLRINAKERSLTQFLEERPVFLMESEPDTFLVKFGGYFNPIGEGLDHIVMSAQSFFGPNGLPALVHELIHAYAGPMRGFKYGGPTVKDKVFTGIDELMTEAWVDLWTGYDPTFSSSFTSLSTYSKVIYADTWNALKRKGFFDNSDMRIAFLEFGIEPDADQLIIKVLKIPEVDQYLRTYLGNKFSTTSDFDKFLAYFYAKGIDLRQIVYRSSWIMMISSASGLGYVYRDNIVSGIVRMLPGFEVNNTITPQPTSQPPPIIKKPVVKDILVGTRDIYSNNSQSCFFPNIGNVLNCSVIDGTNDRNRLCNGGIKNNIYVYYESNPPKISDFLEIKIIGSSTLCIGSSSSSGGGIPITVTPSPSPIGSISSGGSAKPDQPQQLTGSCNQGSLALSWNKVSGANRYQMRGKKINRNIDGLNYIPTSNWTDNVSESDRIGNSEGTEYNCFGDRCSLSFNELDPSSEYKVWVNAVSPSGLTSVNSYAIGVSGSNYVDCKLPEAGGTASRPTNASASCNNGIVSVSWDNVLASSQNVISQFNFPVRGFATNSDKYFPPTNWTDGLDTGDTTKILSNNSGSNVNCNPQTNKCTYTDNTPRKGNWRVWVTQKDATSSGPNVYQSINSYVPGLVWCGE